MLSPWAQRAGEFKVHPLPRLEDSQFDCMTAPDQAVWKDHLSHDRRASPADLACFRLDWSAFLAQQTDRSRTLLAMLAEGHKQVEVAGLLGTTASTVCQRRKKARREWAIFQGENDGAGQHEPASATGDTNVELEKRTNRCLPHRDQVAA